MRNTNKNATENSFSKLLVALLVSSSLIFSGCSDSGQNDSSAKDGESAELSEKKKDEKPAVPVEVVSVSRGDIQQTYQTITTLEAEKDADVVARSSGLVQEILVEEGDMVEKGQLMAQLDVEQLSLEVAQLSATSKKLKKELERQTSLYARKLGSSDTLDRAKFEYESQLAQYKLSKLKLNYASIKAPISGIVTERMVKQGNFINNNDKLFSIVDPSSLVAVLHLPEKELSNVQKNQQILLAMDALNNQVILGSIDRIRPLIDKSTGTFKVVAKLDNPNNKLQSGMFGKVEVVFDMHADSLLLEQQAVITQDNRSHVFVVRDEKAIQTPVSIGFKHNGILEITDGLKENDQVITTGQQILKHDTRVEVIGLEDAQVAEPTNNESNSAGKVAANP
jgi:membrane fusion protein (multidrug efflux system)